MSVGCQIRDGYTLRTKSRPPLRRLRCDQAGMAERNSAHTACLSDVVHISLITSETYGRAGHCKQTVQGMSNTFTHLLIQGSIAHHPFTDSIAYTGDLMHWATPCRLVHWHQPQGSTVTPKEGKKERTLYDWLIVLLCGVLSAEVKWSSRWWFIECWHYRYCLTCHQAGVHDVWSESTASVWGTLLW